MQVPMISAFSASLSGMSAASTRIHAAAHNVANMLTDDFHPVRVTQSAPAAGGTRAVVETAAQPRPVEFAEEAVQMILGKVQFRASSRVIETEMDLLGGLLDLEV